MSRRSRTEVFDVERLTMMSLAELRQEWARRYGAPPKLRAAELVRRVLAWRIQSDRTGGFDATTRRMLTQEQATVMIPAVPGMRLAREWAGVRHEVIVTYEGVIYKDQPYGSLSEVARLITGQRWNGPRFFGLRNAGAR